MSNKRPEPHVAQQSRRDKLRIIQNNNNPQHLEDFPNNLEQLSLEPRFNSDLLQVRTVRNNANMLYEPGFYSSEMVNFSIDSNPFSESGRLMMPQFASVYPHSSPDQHCEARNVSNWRNNNNGSHSHQGYDWVINETNPNPNSIFVPEIHNDLTATREIHQSTTLLQDIIFKSEMASPILQQTSHGIWAENSNQQLVSLPNFVNRSNQSRFGNNSNNSWTNPTGENSLHQGLSLSLSSNVQSTEPCGSDHEPHQSPCVVSKEPQFSKSVKSSNMFSVVSGDCGKSSLQNMVVGISSNNTIGYRNVGPLGPFTGYATILKSSNFLEPAQQLLEEICSQSTQKLTKRCEVSSTSSGAVNAARESGVGSKDSNLGVSSSTFHSSIGNGNENENENCGDRGSRLSSRPEYQQRMAKFLYMQEEVIRRYKQHHQQMKMVLSSFESVAGLSSSTPYVSKALKSVSRQFKYLENAISDQLKHIQEVLGEEVTASTSAGTTSSSKFVSNMARVRFMDQSFQKNKFILGSTGLLEHQHHAWRPHQKGLPERAVAVLRAWLFDHFLHPYPTDADKHMLAAQTGLSRNQVSNWFINARVRVWKPMVEEIHMLETKGMTGDHINDNQNSSKIEGPSAVESGVNNQIQEVEELDGAEEWNGEKRCKVQCEIRSSMDGTLMSTFVPYRRGETELDVGEVGSVSLTLGLRHGVEGQQQLLEEDQHQHQQHRRYFGGQMIDDFVGL